MSTLSKRATVYFDPDIHKALKIKAAETSRSLSDLIDDAIRLGLAEDEEDLQSFKDPSKEKSVSFKREATRYAISGEIRGAPNLSNSSKAR